MANLRANKLTGTEVFETTGSVQFSSAGTRECLIVSSSSDFAYGTGDFTIEGWVLFNSNRTAPGGTDGQRIFLQGQSGTSEVALHYYFTNQQFELDISGTGTQTISYGIGVGQWFHVALVRTNSTKYDLYVDGKLIGTKYSSRSQLANNFIIGGLNWADNYGTVGHISNVRIVRGAVYTKNFTPPTRELTVIPNTVLLCCQSTTRANEERTGKTITVNGNAVANELTPGLLTDRIRSGGSSSISGSVEFDGTGDYLSLADSNDWDITGDYTIEFWAKLNFSDASYTDVILATGTLAGSTGFQIGIYDKDLLVRVNSTQYYNVSVGRMTYDGWNHIAAVWNGSSFKIYLNGVQIHSGTAETTSTSTSLIIGNQTDLDSNRYFNGFISNLRIVKGTALYTQNFIPPTRELKNLPGTVLLCCQNSKSATQEATGKTITVNGNATARYFTPPVGFDGFVNFDGATKIKTPNYFYLPTGTTEDRGRGRGIFGGAEISASPSFSNAIEYIQIQTQGNAIDFGDLIQAKRFPVACSSSTRGVFGGGSSPSNTNVIEYITISSTSNSTDFGDLIAPTARGSSCSSSTRGLFGGGYAPATPTLSNAIDYITIASTGNSNDFGDLTISRFGPGAFSSSSRGVFFGGSVLAASPATYTNTIDYATISSTGNALDFGDISVAAIREVCGCSNATRGVYGSGYIITAPTVTLSNVLEYLTISSTGNGIDFGDLTSGKVEVYGSTSNSIRGVWGGGQTPSLVNTIDFITISSTGNAQDFGDLTGVRCGVGACSDSHGGLG